MSEHESENGPLDPADHPNMSPEAVEYLNDTIQQVERMHEEQDNRYDSAVEVIQNAQQLIEKWETQLEEYDGPGEVELIPDKSPSEGPIAGLAVRDEYGALWHLFRLYPNETAAFIEIAQPDQTTIHIDPMMDPIGEDRARYASQGVPQAVKHVLDHLELTGRWERACDEREHEPEVMNKGSKYEHLRCGRCELSAATLSWLGHNIDESETEVAEE